MFTFGLMLVSSRAALAQPADCCSQELMDEYRQWHSELPGNPAIIPRDPVPDVFSWDAKDENGDIVSYIGPSSAQFSGECWLTADVHALQVLAAYDAVHYHGYAVPAGLTERGIWLNNRSWIECAVKEDLPGVIPTPPGDFPDYSVSRWNNTSYTEHFGYVEHCIDPIISAWTWPPKRSCGVCDRYRTTVPNALSTWSDCGWIQAQSPDAPLLFRSGNRDSIDLEAFRPTRDATGNTQWTDPNHVYDYDGLLNVFASYIYHNGPIVVDVFAHGWVISSTPGVLACSNPANDGTNHLVAMIGYDKLNRTVIIQNSWQHNTKELRVFDFPSLAMPTQLGGCGLGWDSYYYPSGSKPPFEVGPTTTTTPESQPPLRCDVDLDGVDGYANGFQIDNCPEISNAGWFDMQFDFDQDGIGNACDDDIDGDGVIGLYDCNDYLAGLRWDLDQDGLCDHWHMNGSQDHLDCNASCLGIKNFLTNHYGYIPVHWGQFLLYGCNDMCLRPWDNCADGRGQSASTDFTQFDSPACQEVHTILSDGRGPDPNVPGEVAAFDTCRDLYFNADQDPANPVGRKCQTGVHEIEFAPIDDTGCGSPDTYRVAFTANAASVDPAGELFMGTSVESCACARDWANNPYPADWDPLCREQECNTVERPPWNPIRDEVFESSNPTYPHGLTNSFPWSRAFSILHEMGRDRQVTFLRDSSQNRHEFTWPWRNTIHYPQPWDDNALANPQDASLYLTHTDAFPVPLKVRIARKEFISEATMDDPFDEDNVDLSDGLQYFTEPPPPWQCFTPPYEAEFDRWWWLRNPYRFDDRAWRMAPMGWAVIDSPKPGEHVVEFHRSLASPSSIRKITYLPGTNETVSLEGLSTVVGRLDSNLVGQKYGKTDAVFAYGVPAGETTRKLWIGLVGSPDNLWVTADQVFGGSIEELKVGSPMFFDEKHQKLFVIGDLLNDGNVIKHNTISAFDFHTGQWVSLGLIRALGHATGYSVSFDPLRRQVFLFGGELNGSTLDRLLVMDLDTLTTRVLWKPTAAGDTWGRSGHGATFDAMDRTLYIYGGERDRVARSDALAYRVVGQTWTQLWTGAQGGPGPLSQPMVHYDRRTKKLWVAADWSGGSAPGQLAPWELDTERGEWHLRPSLGSKDPVDGSRDGSFSEDAAPRFDILIDESAPLRGEVRLVEVFADGPSLELHVKDDYGRPLASDERQSTELHVVLFGQAGERYEAHVEAGPGYDRGSTVSFTYLDRPAALELVTSFVGLSNVTGLVVVGDVAYVGHGHHVSALDLSDPESPNVLGSVCTGGLVQELVRCGERRLCVAQTYGPRSLVVLDIEQPGSPTVAGGLPLPGLCRSVAVRDGVAYVGCGVFGVHLVTLLDPGAPQLVDTLSLGGLVVDVKVRRGLLVASLAGKRIKVLALGTGTSPQVIASHSTTRHPVQGRLIGGRLHVAEVGLFSWLACLVGLRCGYGGKVEVFALDEAPGAASLTLLGQYQGAWARAPYAAGLGDLVLAPTRRGFRVYRAVALP